VVLGDQDIEAIVRLVEATELAPPVEERDRQPERSELQRQLGAGQIDVDRFSRAWKALDRPTPLIARQGALQQLEQARTLLSHFGELWRDLDVPAALKAQAAREIFERIELDGSRVSRCTRARSTLGCWECTR
jgi:hypothetical protein